MLRRPRSIAFRVASVFIFGMALIMVISTVVTLIVFLLADSKNPQRVAVDIVGKLLQSAMVYDRSGKLMLNEDGIAARIIGFADDKPEFWYLLSDGKQAVVHGTIPPEALGLIEQTPPQIFSSKFYYLTDGERHLGLRLADEKNPEHVVVLGGVSLTETQTIFASLWGVWPQGLYHFLGVILLATAMIVVIAVKRTIAVPVRRVVNSAAQIDGIPNGRRISDHATPAELKPMVGAFNTALMRIDDAFEAQRNFLAGASHELRTPLTKLRLKLDLVNDPKVRNDLIRDVTCLASIVTTSLQLARLSGQSLTFSTLNLTVVARSIIADHVPPALKQGMEIELKAPETPVKISGSEPAIRVALDNLIINAMRHAGGTKVLTIEVRSGGVLQMTDQGRGIPAAEREAMLRPYRRGSDPACEGTGMGLALVAQVMRAHGGSVELGDAADGGLVVTLVFPQTSKQISSTA